MSDDRLCECDYCGVLRVYTAGASCPGCGAPLTPGERKKSIKPEEPAAYSPMLLDQARGMQQSQLDRMNQALGMQQSSPYLNQLGMQQQMLNQEMASMFGMPSYMFGRPERRRKK